MPAHPGVPDGVIRDPNNAAHPADDPRAALPALHARWPGWLITWGPWRRTYTAFECRDPLHCKVIEAPTIDQLQRAMAEVEAGLKQPGPDL